ncbi:XRE family transcriptional regulator [Streptomyces sp. NPDC057307]|uniref:nSTAND1 domain-containing NTPase n=1 Tax=Streptomyces sp. NPDC057307 TaxID=3346096 RepID=UPI00363A8DD5
MSRGERPLDPGDGPILQFAARLRLLRQKAGNPAYRILAERAHYSIATLSGAAAGRQLPTLAVTLAYVRVCGGDEEEWESIWRKTAAMIAVAAPVKQDKGRPPYAGLAAFQPDDADSFFGRERLVGELAARLPRQRVLALFGASGSGKSSILRAGLLPRVPDALVLTPGPHPLEECAIQLSTLARNTPGELLTELTGDPLGLHRIVRQIMTDRPSDAELVFLIDQFEETFTLCSDPGERAAFISALVSAAQAPNSRCRVVLAVRADFYVHCTHHPDLVDALRDAQITVGPMTTDELRRAIVQPARHAGLTVEAALLATLTAQAHGRVGVLPLLSHALLETWRRRRGNALTLAGFEAAGGFEGSLAQTAEVAYSTLNPPQRQLARQIFVRLTALGEGTEDTKRQISRAELDSTPDTTIVLERVAGSRLLTLDRDRIEIAHEALIRCWPRLTRWLSDGRDSLRTHRRVTEATDLWESLDRDPDALYRGTRLAAAQELPDTALTERERAFLDASVAAEAAEATRVRRRVRLLRQFVALLAVLFVSASGATVYALRMEEEVTQQRNIALAQKAAGEAVGLRLLKPSLAVQLSLAGYRLAPGNATRDALLSTMATTVSGHSQVVSSVAVSPDGRTLATASHDRTIRLWNVTDPHRPVELSTFTAHPDAVFMVAFSPDGRTLASGSRDRTIRLWNVTDPRAPSRHGTALTGHSDTVFSVTFSPDGRTLASGSYDRTIRLWDITEVTRPVSVSELPAHTLNVKPVVFSPDGRTLASGSDDRTVRLWNVTDPRRPARLATLAGHKDFVAALAFSPDGRTLASGSDDRTVRLWDVSDLRGRPSPVRILRGHGDVISGLAFSPDGKALATSSYDRTARVWDLAGAEAAPAFTVLTGHLGALQAVVFTPDGSRIVTAGAGDSTAQIWDTDTPSAVSRACAQDHPPITRAEWAHYFPGLEYQPPCPKE